MIVKCPRCKGKGKQPDYTTMIMPPVWLLGRFIDWIGGPDAPMDVTYDPCERCNGVGYISIDAKDLGKR